MDAATKARAGSPCDAVATAAAVRVDSVEVVQPRTLVAAGPRHRRHLPGQPLAGLNLPGHRSLRRASRSWSVRAGLVVITGG